MGETEKHLMDAFAGESQANRKYLAFAAQADKEGYKQVAKLFRAAADAETVHALSHLAAAGKVRTTKENLETAIAGETYEFEEMYPPMIQSADVEGNKRGRRSLDYANQVEKVHAALYKKALESLGKNQEVEYYVCQVCGHTVEGEPPDKCPVCQAIKKAFKKID